MPLERANQLFLHPIHQDAYRVLVELIVSLRQCRKYEDYYHFQQDLLTKVLAVQEHRAACTRAAKRLRSGKSVSADAPALRAGDTNDAEAWELEADVCERVDRQLRSIADALAWRAFSYDRPVIVALSRNDPPGPMVDKEGLEAEKSFVTQSWKDESCFVLLHDLTSCLRIGDVTRFRPVGQNGYEASLHELKTDPNRKRSAQLRRQKLAEAAIRDGGPLPNNPDTRLVALDTRYKTHFKMLRNAFEMAATRGLQGLKVPGGRALVAANLFKGYELWPEAEFLERTGVAHDRACKRAGILGRGHLVTFYSNDIVARSPTFPPWAIYPLPPVVCAGLIVDIAAYFVTISSEPLLDALRAAGFAAKWVLPRDLPQLQPGQEILRVHNRIHATGLTSAEMSRLTLELVDLPTWVEGIKDMFAREDIEGRPWPYFADEYKVWA